MAAYCLIQATRATNVAREKITHQCEINLLLWQHRESRVWDFSSVVDQNVFLDDMKVHFIGPNLCARTA